MVSRQLCVVCICSVPLVPVLCMDIPRHAYPVICQWAFMFNTCCAALKKNACTVCVYVICECLYTRLYMCVVGWWRTMPCVWRINIASGIGPHFPLWDSGSFVHWCMRQAGLWAPGDPPASTSDSPDPHVSSYKHWGYTMSVLPPVFKCQFGSRTHVLLFVWQVLSPLNYHSSSPYRLYKFVFLKLKIYRYPFMYLFCVCVSACLRMGSNMQACHSMHVWIRGQLVRVSPLFPPLGTGDGTQIVRHGSRCLYSLSYLGNPLVDF